MNNNMYVNEFLNKFPKAKLNIGNPKINAVLESFVDQYNDQFDKSWHTVKKIFRKHFEDNGIVFPKCNDMKPEFWIARGWDNPKEKISEISKNKPLPQTPAYWIKKGFVESEAKTKAKKFYDENIRGKRLLPTQIEYYIQKKGMTKKEAEKALTKEQAKRTQKLVDKETENPELRKRRLWNQIEYWTNKGYSEEQGYQLMREKFEERNLQTMKTLVQKFIIDGFDEKEALDKAQKSYKERAKKTMQTRIKNNSFGWQKASKQSLDFFKPLMEKLDKDNIEYYVGVDGNSEWFLASGTDYFYSYDFCIPSKKLIIEYNGEHIHPNPKMDEKRWSEWRHCWTNKTAKECRAEDLKKIGVAKKLGYNVIEIFESDNVNSLTLI